MLIVSIILVSLFSLSSAFAAEIREFSIPTLERLGNELYRRDQIAARATDIVLETQPVARALKMRGWITELRKNGDVVYWITDTPSGPTLAYTVSFANDGKPEVQDRRGQPITPRIAVRYKARQTATEALKGRLYKIVYNLEVLDDPDGSGFLVYALAATKDPNEVVMAGHFRVTVSADGAKTERVDALSKDLLISNKKQGATAGSPVVAMVLIRLVSARPVETLIYTNRLTGLPILVATPPNGKMKDTGHSAGKK